MPAVFTKLYSLGHVTPETILGHEAEIHPGLVAGLLQGITQTLIYTLGQLSLANQHTGIFLGGGGNLRTWRKPMRTWRKLHIYCNLSSVLDKLFILFMIDKKTWSVITNQSVSI